MKKLLALSLAALMVMSLSVTAFATISTSGNIAPKADEFASSDVSDHVITGFYDPQGFGVDSDGVVEIHKPITRIDPGKTMYYLLGENTLTSKNIGSPAVSISNLSTVMANDNDATKSISITQSWTLNKELVEKVAVVQKRWTNGSIKNYAYFLAITAKASTTTVQDDVAGTVTLKKNSGTVDGKNFKFTLKASLGFTVGYNRPGSYAIGSTPTTYEAKDSAGKDVTGEMVFTFTKFEGATFEVDVTGQGKLLVGCSSTFNAEIAGKYPAANIDFFNGNGASFNKIGVLKIPADPGSFIYAINADGTLSEMPAATYDDSEECFVVKTRTLGKYAISDVKLDIAAVVAPASSAPAPASSAPATGVKPNPGTGAIA